MQEIIQKVSLPKEALWQVLLSSPALTKLSSIERNNFLFAADALLVSSCV
jgi:hypothetical protein